MARKRANPGSGGPNWLDTYSDMVTLLLTFFVMLFAMSTMDAGKWEKLVKAFSANKQASAVTQEAAQENIQIAANSTSLPSSGSESETSSSKAGNSDDGKVTDFDSLYKYLVDYVNRNGLQDSVHVHKGKNYTFLTFQNSVFFSGDSAELRDQGKKILDFLCDGIKKYTGSNWRDSFLRAYGPREQLNFRYRPSLRPCTFFGQGQERPAVCSVEKILSIRLKWFPRGMENTGPLFPMMEQKLPGPKTGEWKFIFRKPDRAVLFWIRYMKILIMQTRIQTKNNPTQITSSYVSSVLFSA